MPYLTVEGGPLDAAQKKDLIEQLTATASAIMHVPYRRAHEGADER
ncbi:tautomerase family protein [Eggerthella sinensis]|nr:hypothetical protein [Eggerthella sinensis]